MGRYWLKVGRKIYDDSWKSIWLLVITVANLLQLPPVRGKLKDSNSVKYLLDFQLWHLFEYPELTEIVREKDKLFIDLLNKFQVVNANEYVEKLLKARLIH